MIRRVANDFALVDCRLDYFVGQFIRGRTINGVQDMHENKSWQKCDATRNVKGYFNDG